MDLPMGRTHTHTHTHILHKSRSQKETNLFFSDTRSGHIPFLKQNTPIQHPKKCFKISMTSFDFIGFTDSPAFHGLDFTYFPGLQLTCTERVGRGITPVN